MTSNAENVSIWWRHHDVTDEIHVHMKLLSGADRQQAITGANVDPDLCHPTGRQSGKCYRSTYGNWYEAIGTPLLLLHYGRDKMV